jgi:hypothetical protein
LDEFLTKPVPEIDVAVENCGPFDEVLVEMVVDEAAPFTRHRTRTKERFEASLETKIV